MKKTAWVGIFIVLIFLCGCAEVEPTATLTIAEEIAAMGTAPAPTMEPPDTETLKVVCTDIAHAYESLAASSEEGYNVKIHFTSEDYVVIYDHCFSQLEHTRELSPTTWLSENGAGIVAIEFYNHYKSLGYFTGLNDGQMNFMVRFMRSKIYLE